MFWGIRRDIRRISAGPFRQAPRWSRHRDMAHSAVVLVSVFYAVVAFELYSAARGLTHLAGSHDRFDFLWPVKWMEWVPVTLAGDLLAHLNLLAAVLGILLWRIIWVRLLVSFAILQHAGLGNSFGAMSHGLHEMFWISVCLWMLPDARVEEILKSRALRMRFLYAFGMASAVILFFYSMSGFYKFTYSLIDMSLGHGNGLSPEAFAQTVARRAMETNSEPLWAPPLLAFPIAGWPAYLGLYYVELVSIVVLLRPQLYRVWGGILIMFHMGTLLFMDIIFPYHLLFNALFIFLSPMALPTPGWKGTLGALPIFGWVFRRVFGWSNEAVQ